MHLFIKQNYLNDKVFDEIKKLDFKHVSYGFSFAFLVYSFLNRF